MILLPPQTPPTRSPREPSPPTQGPRPSAQKRPETFFFSYPDFYRKDNRHFFPNAGKFFPCYPNPVVNSATIHLDNAAPETVRLRVTTLDGRLLRSSDLTANPGQDLTLDLSTAPKGILLVSIATASHEQTLKILKQ
ncbi:T9SS type A sorting domain-containing protein [Puia sp.]|uniref:T9SS type A sorting domain-containing protein n=1 Tax=Puia sp. TaxID=2045100 RepID=UPI002F3FBAB3